MRTDHVNSSATSPHHPYFFREFFPNFFIWNYKIYHIWQFLVFILVTGFQCHSVLVNSGDCSGEITRISKFHGRSEILAGKFHWNGTRIRWNDRNPAGICGASLRPRPFALPGPDLMEVAWGPPDYQRWACIWHKHHQHQVHWNGPNSPPVSHICDVTPSIYGNGTLP